MNILTLNCGSSSLKYRMIAMPEEKELAAGEAQRIGPKTAEPSRIIHKRAGSAEDIVRTIPISTHAEAFDGIMDLLAGDPVVMPDGIGHRVVHGGACFRWPAIIDSDVIKDLEATMDLAPLHNPPAINLIKTCRARFPDMPQAAVFDTAFHSTIPDYARTYAIPKMLRQDMGLRKYGFHGTSHQFVVEESARWLGRDMNSFNAVSCHLGSGGASICAVANGLSVDNTMGYGPLQGLVMSTRCGDLDPAIAIKLMMEAGTHPESVETALNKSSGVLGLSGVSGDIRDVLSAISRRDCHDLQRMNHAAQVYLWRIRKYLGAYLAVIGRTDAIIFTDTIGESSPFVRWSVCVDMEFFGLEIDRKRNENASCLPADIASDASPVRILVFRTNEELAIARQAYGEFTRNERAKSA